MNQIAGAALFIGKASAPALVMAYGATQMDRMNAHTTKGASISTQGMIVAQSVTAAGMFSSMFSDMPLSAAGGFNYMKDDSYPQLRFNCPA
jgi:hypothetical protein